METPQRIDTFGGIVLVGGAVLAYLAGYITCLARKKQQHRESMQDASRKMNIKNKMKIRELVVEAGAVNCFGTTY
jgi:hypothetical protein